MRLMASGDIIGPQQPQKSFIDGESNIFDGTKGSRAKLRTLASVLLATTTPRESNVEEASAVVDFIRFLPNRYLRPDGPRLIPRLGW